MDSFDHTGATVGGTNQDRGRFTGGPRAGIRKFLQLFRPAKPPSAASSSRARLFEDSFDLHPDALVISVDGCVRAANAQAAVLFGYPRDEMVGRQTGLLFSDAPDLSLGYRRDGAAFSAEISTRPLPDTGVLTIVRPANSAPVPTDADQLNHDIFDSSHVGLIVLNRDLRYVAWNPMMERISGRKACEVLGRHPLELFPFLKEAGVEELWRRALGGETLLSPDFPFEVPQGRKGWSSQTVGPLRNFRGEIVGVIVSVSDVTERKNAEDALRASEERFRGLVESAPVPMLVAADRVRIRLVNRQFNASFGYTRDEVWDMNSWEQRAYPDPEYRQEIREKWKQATTAADLAGKTTLGPVDSWITCLDGSVRFVEVHLCRHESFSLVVFNDLTQHRRAEEALRENEARLRSIVGSLPVMIAALDHSGRFVSWNRECERVSGYSAAEMIGNPKGFNLLFPDEAARAQVAARRRKPGPAEPWRITRKDGTVRAVRWIRVSHRQPVPGWALWGVGIDLTEQLRLEEQLRQAQKMQAVGQLAGGIAHDFNNLLTVINGYSDSLLRRVPETDANHNRIAAIRSAGERAASLVRQLLLFSRKAVARPQCIDLKELLPQTLGMLRRLIDEDIAISSELDSDVDPVEADQSQMEQVVMNLCLNARDAISGHGRIVVAARNVTLIANDCAIIPGSRPGDFVRLTITDTGSGMKPEVQAHLFEPFFTTKAVGAGTGLGLATVYGIVQQAGGFVLVESEPEHGSAFHIFLPPARGAEAHSVLPEPVPIGGHSGETVLLVEDDEQVRTIASLFLEQNGYRVITASTGAEALDLASRTDEPIHLLLSDVVMPEMSGHELAGRIARLRPEIKVLLMSGYNEDRIAVRGMKAPHLLHKPFTETELMERIRETLGRAG